MSTAWEKLKSLRRRVPLGVQALVAIALASVLLLGLAAFADLPGPSLSDDGEELAYCSPGDAEVRAPAEPPPGPGEWREEPNLPTSLAEVRSATVGDRVFVGTGAELGDNRLDSVDRLYAYDPRSGQYEEHPATPEPLHHAQLVGYGGDLYVVGGYPSGPGTNGLWRYSLDEGRWTELEGMRLPRGAHGAAVIGDRLYVVGGTLDFALDQTAAPTKSMQVYDFSTGVWSEAPGMPTARHHLGVAALDGKLYAAGGREVGDLALDSFERFDPATGRWETLPPLPQGVSGLTLAAAGGEIYAIAGADNEIDGWVTPATWAFDPERGQWRRAADVEVPRSDHTAVTFDGRIYILGGAPCVGFGRTDSVESLAPS
jgi:Kelch motif